MSNWKFFKLKEIANKTKKIVKKMLTWLGHEHELFKFEHVTKIDPWKKVRFPWLMAILSAGVKQSSHIRQRTTAAVRHNLPDSFPRIKIAPGYSRVFHQGHYFAFPNTHTWPWQLAQIFRGFRPLSLHLFSFL